MDNSFSDGDSRNLKDSSLYTIAFKTFIKCFVELQVFKTSFLNLYNFLKIETGAFE